MPFTKVSTCLRVQVLWISFLCLMFATSVHSQAPLDQGAQSGDVTRVLLDRDITLVANELAAEPATTKAPLLRRLIIYARAGQSERVRKTLEELAAAPDWQCTESIVERNKIKEIIGNQDLVAWRTYYERLCPRDAYGAEDFARLWDKEGDPKELDAWLGARSKGTDLWFTARIIRRAKLGTAGELLEPFVAAVKANPRDLNLIDEYMRANSLAGRIQDSAWVADVYEANTAYEFYELGRRLENVSPQTAVGLFEKALQLPFTERDAEHIQRLVVTAVSTFKVNLEKQLRYWIKLELAQTYRAVGRVQEAQRLVEELTASKGDDIFLQDAYHLSGMTQASSGQRTVERAILGKQATQANSLRYWYDRINYYSGRNEYDLEKDTYKEALDSFPYNAADRFAGAERLEIVRSFSSFLYKERNRNENWETELTQLLRRESSLTPPETNYSFEIARLITHEDYELDELRSSIFIKQPNTLARLLAARGDWKTREETLIEDSIEEDDPPEQKEKIWIALEKLINDPGSARAFSLAQAMRSEGAPQRAVPLLNGYLKALAARHENRDEATSALFWALRDQGDWRAAEKLLFANKERYWEEFTNMLGALAVTAAQNGATGEAMRIWRLKVNLDRRDLSWLFIMAQTDAKPQLQALYLQMKKHDPLSSVPEAALQVLQQFR